MTLAAARITGAPADGSVERVQGVEGVWGEKRGCMQNTGCKMLNCKSRSSLADTHVPLRFLSCTVGKKKQIAVEARWPIFF